MKIEVNQIESGTENQILKIQSGIPKWATSVTESINTAWSEYEDETDTIGNHQLIPSGTTQTLTNDSNVVRNTQMPVGYPNFFNAATSKITPQYKDDFYTIDLMFKVKNSILGGHFDFWVDIPGIGIRFKQSRICPKAAGTETNINISFNCFVSDEFALNGGTLKIEASNGDLQVYDKQFRICRIHKGQ